MSCECKFKVCRSALLTACLVLVAAGLSSCGSSGGDGRFAYFITLNGLPDLSGVRGHYEGWAVINNLPFSTGKFRVLGVGPGAEVRTENDIFSLGTAANAQFGPTSTGLGERFPRIVDATHLFITFEPEGDNDRTPSCQVLMAGAIVSDQAALTTAGLSVASDFPCAQPAIGGGFILGLGTYAGATGEFRLMTPTNDLSNPTPDDDRGVWFVRNGMMGLEPGLVLPPAPGGWTYEGFARVDGVWRSTGKFTRVDTKDNDALIALQRGPDSAGPAAPGQDFVLPFQPALTLDPPVLRLSSALAFADGDFRAFVTVEPHPDNDPAPFEMLQILSTTIGDDLVDTFDRGVDDRTMTRTDVNLPVASANVTPSLVTLTGITLQALSTGVSDRSGHYELWVEDAGGPHSFGKFLVRADGEIVSWPTLLSLGNQQNAVFAGSASAPFGEIFVTLECQGDNDLIPGTVLLAGSAASAPSVLTVRGNTALGGRGIADFSTAAGLFQLDTTSDDPTNLTPNDSFGILYRTFGGSDQTAAGLSLPNLPTGWCYESFIEDRTTGRRFSTGRFRRTNGPDDDDMTSLSRGPDRVRGFPGQDFVVGVTRAPIPAASMITDVLVTLEPSPDNSTEPFFLTLLSAIVPGNAVAGGVSQTNVPLQNISGQVMLSASMRID